MLRDLLFLGFTFGCILIVFRGLLKKGIAIRPFLIVLVIWVIIISALAHSGFLSDFSTFPPRMLLVLVAPIVGITWFTLSKKSDLLLEAVPSSWIVNLQSFRVVVELFLWWAFLDHVLPVQMTFEGRNFDILVGITAPFAVMWFLGSKTQRPIPLVIWNLAGLLLLFNIVVIAVLSMPTPMRYFTNDPANTLVATFPWVLLPGILVALAFALHLFSLKQMIRKLKGNSSSS